MLDDTQRGRNLVEKKGPKMGHPLKVQGSGNRKRGIGWFAGQDLVDKGGKKGANGTSNKKDNREEKNSSLVGQGD